MYRSDKVVPYCPRCGTALSSHEVALGYRRSRTPRRTSASRSRDAPGESLLVWTTTPWTLPANQAAAVNPDVRYAAVEHDGETLILAEPLVREVLGEDARILRAMDADELLGREYEPPFPYLTGAHRVVEAGFVTTEDGTGIVHIAPAFGEDDMATARVHGLDAPNPVGPDGRFTEAVAPWAGRAVKEADADLVGGPRRARAPAARGGASPLVSRTAGAAGPRSSTTPSPPGTSARPPCATACWS